MNKIIYLLTTLLPIALTANTIFVNGAIYTVNKNKPWVEAVVVDNKKISYVGTTKKALTYTLKNTRIIDLKGQFMMPGIIDAHTHIAIAALLLNLGVGIKNKGKRNILKQISQYAQEHPQEEIISGFGFYPFSLGENGPTAEQLDSVIPNKKVFLISNNGHSAWVNSKTLHYLGISSNTKDPLPGMQYYMRDSNGAPTGFLVEGEAFWPHFKKMNIATPGRFYKSLKSFLPTLSKYGVTSIFDAGIPAVEENAFLALQKLEKENLLPVRYFASHYIVSDKDAQHSVKEYKRLKHLYDTKLLNINAVKFSNDNSSNDNFAIQFDTEKLRNYIGPLLANNINIMIHTTQDASVNQALNALEKLKKKYPKSKSRISLAHVNMVRQTDFYRMNNLNIIANIQPFNAAGNGYYEYKYMLFEAWEKKLVRFKTFFDNNITVSASSDFPACDISYEKCTPFLNMEIAVTRQKVGTSSDAAVLSSSQEKLSIEQIIQAYTLNAAYQLGAEKSLGSIEAGKNADLIVLNQNLLDVNEKKIHKTIVNMTIMNGEIVYEKQ